MLLDKILAENIEYDIADSGANGTSLRGEIMTTYDILLNLFGEPSYSSGDPYDKVNTEWIIDGKVFYTDQWGEKDWEYIKATVYNWKTGGVPLDEYDWHIGGENYDVVEMIQTIVENGLQPEYNWND